MAEPKKINLKPLFERDTFKKFNIGQLSELYYILSGEKVDATRDILIDKIISRKDKPIPDTPYINIMSKKETLFTVDGNKNISAPILKLLLQLLYGKDSKKATALKGELRQNLIAYNQDKNKESMVDVAKLVTEMSRTSISEPSSPNTSMTLTPPSSPARSIKLDDIVKRARTWRSNERSYLTLDAMISVAEKIKDYVSSNVKVKGFSFYVNDEETKFKSLGVTKILSHFKDGKIEKKEEIKIYTTPVWDNSTISRVYGTTTVNLSKNHNNGMGLMAQLIERGLYPIMVFLHFKCSDLTC